MFAPGGSKYKIILLYFVIGFLNYFMEGFMTLYANTAIETYKDFYNQSFVDRGQPLSNGKWNFLWGLTAACIYPGLLLGNLITPVLVERYGRKTPLMIGNAMRMVTTCLTILTIKFESPELYMVVQCFSNIGPGILYIGVVLFFQETSPTKYRGLTIILGENSYGLGCVIGAICGWRSILGRELIIATALCYPFLIMAIILYAFMEESPKYLLIQKNNRKRALEAIEFYQGKKQNNEKLLDEIYLEAIEEKSAKRSLSFVIQVFKLAHLRRAYLVGCATLQVSTTYYLFLNFSTAFYSKHFSGETSEQLSFGFIVSSLLGGVIGTRFIDRIGRRPLYLINYAISITSLITYVTFDNLAYNCEFCKWLMFISTIVFSFVYGFALTPISMSITPEMVVQEYRSIVQTMAFSTGTVFYMVFTVLGLYLPDLFSSLVLIPIYIAPAIISYIYLYLQMPETCGREVHSVAEEMIRDAAQGKTSPIDQKNINLEKLQNSK